MGPVDDSVTTNTKSQSHKDSSTHGWVWVAARPGLHLRARLPSHGKTPQCAFAGRVRPDGVGGLVQFFSAKTNACGLRAGFH